jgi:hypothetical protein
MKSISDDLIRQIHTLVPVRFIYVNDWSGGETLLHKLVILVLFILLTGPVLGQSPKVVTAARGNGTYRYRGSEIRVLALGHNKLKVELDLIYEYKSSYGPMANTGQATGEATIENDVAVFHPPDYSDCTITIKFVAGNKIKVTQGHDAGDCGFGNKVSADGTYTKVKAGKPKFELPR